MIISYFYKKTSIEKKKTVRKQFYLHVAPKDVYTDLTPSKVS